MGSNPLKVCHTVIKRLIYSQLYSFILKQHSPNIYICYFIVQFIQSLVVMFYCSFIPASLCPLSPQPVELLLIHAEVFLQEKSSQSWGQGQNKTHHQFRVLALSQVIQTQPLLDFLCHLSTANLVLIVSCPDSCVQAIVYRLQAVYSK